MDIYGDLGKFIKEISQIQDSLFKNIAEQSLILSKYEYEIIKMNDDKKNNENASLEDKIFSKNAQLEKEIKRMKKQKD